MDIEMLATEYVNCCVVQSDNYNNLDNCSNSETAESETLQKNLTVILVYSALFIVAAIGNLTVFISLFRSRHRKSRISLMIRHLAIADLIVTFIMIPIEVGWRLTDRWIAGNLACKVFLFLRAFGPYLSSNVLVCVSLDRYFAVLHPLRVNDARRRGKTLLAVAWGTSFIYCIPQSFVFHVETHPHNSNYKQCVSFGFFTSTSQEIAYNLLCVMFLYFIPLFIIIIAYTAIMCEISKNSKGTRGESYCTSNGRMRLRRSDISNIERARSKTLRMTITIVAVYIWCCTPYVIITLWYMFDRASATKLPQWLQDTFFMMVVSNSCMNPIVYGSYVINFRNVDCKYLSCCRNESIHTLNNANPQVAAGHRGRLARRVIKCVFSFHQKVESGTTRSTTTMLHGNLLVSSPKPNHSNHITSLLIKARSFNKPPNMFAPSVEVCSDVRDGQIAFLQGENTPRQYNKTGFHSDPCNQTDSPFNEQTSLAVCNQVLDCRSEPNMSPMCNIKINVANSEVYYNIDKNRTRNI